MMTVHSSRNKSSAKQIKLSKRNVNILLPKKVFHIKTPAAEEKVSTDVSSFLNFTKVSETERAMYTQIYRSLLLNGYKKINTGGSIRGCQFINENRLVRYKPVGNSDGPNQYPVYIVFDNNTVNGKFSKYTKSTKDTIIFKDVYQNNCKDQKLLLQFVILRLYFVIRLIYSNVDNLLGEMQLSGKCVVPQVIICISKTSSSDQFTQLFCEEWTKCSNAHMYEIVTKYNSILHNGI